LPLTARFVAQHRVRWCREDQAKWRRDRSEASSTKRRSRKDRVPASKLSMSVSHRANVERPVPPLNLSPSLWASSQARCAHSRAPRRPATLRREHTWKFVSLKRTGANEPLGQLMTQCGHVAGRECSTPREGLLHLGEMTGQTRIDIVDIRQKTAAYVFDLFQGERFARFE
jgi:hypothetical protein